MVINWFYLHFRDLPPSGIVEFLESNHVIVRPVYETSFDIAAPFSAAKLKYMLKNAGFSCEFNLVKVKKASEISTSKE